jgi:hypothetical protein
VDTNVARYSVAVEEPAKQPVAREWIDLRRFRAVTVVNPFLRKPAEFGLS